MASYYEFAEACKIDWVNKFSITITLCLNVSNVRGIETKLLVHKMAAIIKTI